MVFRSFLGAINQLIRKTTSGISGPAQDSRDITEAVIFGPDAIHNQYLYNLIERAKLGSLYFNIETNNAWFSPAAQEILGLNQSYVITYEGFRKLVHPDDKPVFDKMIIETAGSNTSSENILKIIKSDSANKELRIISLFLSSVNHDDRTKPISLIAGLIQDITKQEKLKRELTKAKDKAEDSDRYKTILLYNFSHDIRTPMNSIIGFSELLNIGNLAYEKRSEFIRIIKEQGAALLRKIDDFTEFTKIETGKITIRRSPCNIELLLNEIILVFKQYKSLHKKENLEIRIVYPPVKGISLYTDPGRLQQLISNLLGNAIKYADRGLVEISYKRNADQNIEFSIKTPSSISIREGHKKSSLRAWEDEIMKSDETELGITISKNLAKLLGGKLWIELDSNDESVICFTIPYKEIPESYHQITPEEELIIPSYNWKDKVILIVEDDEVNHKFLEAVLQNTSATLLHASNGVQAIELCKSISKIDLILMDIRMPEMDGLQATRHIREFNVKVPIIAQSAFTSEQVDDQYLDAGCNDMILKPINIKEFLDKAAKCFKEYYE